MNKATNRFRILNREFSEVIEALENATSDGLINLLKQREFELRGQMRAIEEANPSLFEDIAFEDEQISFEEEMGLRDDTHCIDLMQFHGPWHG